MHAVCSRENRHTQRLDCLLSLQLPNNQHMHTKRGTYTSPRMWVQRVLTPAQESAEKGMFLGERAEAGPGGGRKAANWVACRPDNNKDWEARFFKDAVAAPSAELWPGCICLPRNAWSPGAPWPSEKG